MTKAINYKLWLISSGITIMIATLFFTVFARAIQHNDVIVSNINNEQDIYSDELLQQWKGHKWLVQNTISSPTTLMMHNQTFDNLSAIQHEDSAKMITVNVRLVDEGKVQPIKLEDYVLAVTLNEMPWSFEDEAIKAQMIAARTYIMYRINKHTDQFEITDTTSHQVYKHIDENTLSPKESERYQHIKQLLKDTEGKIITYKNEPIDALYFSTSNGNTESSQHYFGQDIPYLQSVSSHWDVTISTSFTKQYEFTYDELNKRLKQAGLINNASKKLIITDVKRTKTNRVKLLKVNHSEMTGKQFREALGLASTDFNWKIDDKKKKIVISTFGNGHGVGMSQWGAQGMAQAGYKAEQILQYYYTNVKIESL